MPRQFDVVIERDAEGFYVASVPQIPGCHTQARSLDEVNERIREAITLTGSELIHFLSHPDGRNTVVPVHSGEVIGPGLLHKILRDCGISTQQLSELL